MDSQQEIGGAQALLQLGTKDTKPEDPETSQELEQVNDPGQNGESHMNDDRMLEEKENQQLNDAVEAAVMRYVGGTLDSHEDSMHAQDPDHNGHENDIDNEISNNIGHGNNIGQENGIDTNIGHDNGIGHDNDITGASADHSESSGQKRRLNHDDIMSNMSEYQWDRFLEEDVAEFERTPPKRKRRKSFGSGNDIDPELADLDTTTDHDQLVHAAILGAGDLAGELQIPDRAVPSSSGKPNAISQLAHAASALSDGLKPENASDKTKRPLKKQPENFETHILSRPKYDHSSLELLIEQAANESCVWYNTVAEAGLRGPRLFSREEIQIVENFIDGYCRLNDLTRLDICRRVWLNERTKDNFWESVTKVLPYRSRASVYKHVRRQYHVFEVRARWTAEEDELLKKMASTCSTNWKKIGEVMNRMPEDCRDRWRNYVKCGENRASNKWADDEETALREIVVEMLQNSSKKLSINWTQVSERMNGTRSRIQCRYKWNKLVRRDLAARVAMMDTDTKIWMLNRVLAANFSDALLVDWDFVLHLYHEEHKETQKVGWTALDFKVAFEKMRSMVRDNKTMQLHSLLPKLIAAVYQHMPAHEHQMKAEKPIRYELEPKQLETPSQDEVEAANVADAAVAAVASGASEQESQHQEYSLWR